MQHPKRVDVIGFKARHSVLLSCLSKSCYSVYSWKISIRQLPFIV
ncbi:Unknown protein sequence [Pseudomonas amygdali pv. sesami]|nr:Unknown protein sequence [Pseudomonas amygdali pv. sesami]